MAGDTIPWQTLLDVATGRSLSTTLDRLLREARRLTDARYAAIAILDDSGQVQRFLTDGMSTIDIATIGSPPQGLGLLGALPLNDAPIRLSDISADPRSVGFPRGHPVMTTFLGVPIKAANDTYGHLYLTDKQGPSGPIPFTDADEETTLALAAAAAVAVANARAFGQAQAAQRWQRAISDIATAGLAGAETGEVLQLVARSARELAAADAALLALADSEGRLEVEVAEVSTDADPAVTEFARKWLGRRLSRDTVLHACYESGHSMIAPDLQIEHPAEQSDSDKDWHETRSMAAGVPLNTRERCLGVLALIWDGHIERVGEDSLDVATAFATQAALTLVLAEARQDRDQRVVLEDRERIARDMHDVVVQRVFATGILLQRSLRNEAIPEEERIRIDGALDELNETIREIRATIFDLQQHDPVPLRPSEVIRREIHQATLTLGFEPTVRFHGPIDSLVRVPGVPDSGLTGPIVTAVYQPGYRHAGRVLRPARVAVADS